MPGFYSGRAGMGCIRTLPVTADRLQSDGIVSLRTASYVGFFCMIAIAVAAFALFDQWWLILLGVVVAAAVGWYSLGLYQRASIGSAQRLIRAVATDEDYAEIAELPAHARSAAIRAAAEAPDPQRDRLFQDSSSELVAWRQLRPLSSNTWPTRASTSTKPPPSTSSISGACTGSFATRASATT